MEPTRIARAVSESAFEAIGVLLGPGLNMQAEGKSDLKHRPDIEQSLIEVICRQLVDSPTLTLVLRVHFDHLSRQIKVPNILMPLGMQHQRLGKRVLGELYKVAEAHDYELLVVDLVASFFDRLVCRGAVIVDDHTVKITAQTNLTGDVEKPPSKTEPPMSDLYALILGGASRHKP